MQFDTERQKSNTVNGSVHLEHEQKICIAMSTQVLRHFNVSRLTKCLKIIYFSLLKAFQTVS